jgi:hypothetical protein
MEVGDASASGEAQVSGDSRSARPKTFVIAGIAHASRRTGGTASPCTLHTQ